MRLTPAKIAMSPKKGILKETTSSNHQCSADTLGLGGGNCSIDMNERAKIQSTTTYLFSIKNSLPAGSLKTTSEPKQLVGGFNPSEKYWSNWIMSPNRGENSNKDFRNPPPVRKPELNKLLQKKNRRGLRLAREASLPLFSRGTIPIAGPRQAILLTEHFKNFVANFLES